MQLTDRSGKDISIENERAGATFNSLRVQKVGWAGGAEDAVGAAVSLDGSVSYTHLTLPTIYSV